MGLTSTWLGFVRSNIATTIERLWWNLKESSLKVETINNSRYLRFACVFWRGRPPGHFDCGDVSPRPPLLTPMITSRYTILQLRNFSPLKSVNKKPPSVDASQMLRLDPPMACCLWLCPTKFRIRHWTKSELRMSDIWLAAWLLSFSTNRDCCRSI